MWERMSLGFSESWGGVFRDIARCSGWVVFTTRKGVSGGISRHALVFVVATPSVAPGSGYLISLRSPFGLPCGQSVSLVPRSALRRVAPRQSPPLSHRKFMILAGGFLSSAGPGSHINSPNTHSKAIELRAKRRESDEKSFVAGNELAGGNFDG